MNNRFVGAPCVGAVIVVGLGTVAGGCSLSTSAERGLREGDRIVVKAIASPQIVRASDGAVLSEATFTFTAEATVQDGVARLQGTAERHGPLSSEGLTLPQDSVADVLPLLGFTDPGVGNSSFVAPAYPDGQVDTASTVDSEGNQIVQVTTSGSYGEPKVITIMKNGANVMVAHYTWESVSGGGIRVKTANYKDTSNPEVEIRTTVTVTSAGIVTLTSLDQAKRQAAKVLAGAAVVCLPSELHATERGALGSFQSPCSLALSAGAFALGDFVLSSAAFVAAGPASIPFALRYFGSVGRLISAAFLIGAKCRT